MKRFKLHGNTAYWNGLKLTALNLSTLQEETTSPIPAGKRMYVNVVDNLYEVTDPRKEVLNGEISDSDKKAILSKVKASTPNFLLSLGGKVVGYANLHHRHGTADTLAPNPTDNASAEPIKVEDILGEDLVLLIIPATATTPAKKKVEEKKEEDYFVKQEVTIAVYTKVKATCKEDAHSKVPDLLSKVETFLDENFSPSDTCNYVTSDYTSEAYHC